MRIRDDAGDATWDYRDRYIRALVTAVKVRSTQKVEVTEELLVALVWAQARATAELLLDPYNRMSDDWGDDTDGALTAMRQLFEWVWDASDLVALDLWLNSPYGVDPVHPHTGQTIGGLGNLGCDGIAPELSEINPPALDDTNG